MAHSGETTEGFYLNTLTAVDIFTGWVECQAVWGKTQDRVGSALRETGQRLPFPWLGLDSDNGSEFINQGLLAYCQKHQITFTRSRPYKKNDNAHVEQKNWSVVRRLVGYDRYSSRPAWETLNRLYGLVRWHYNFFNPVMQLQQKTRHGPKVHKSMTPPRHPTSDFWKPGPSLRKGKSSLWQRMRISTPWDSSSKSKSSRTSCGRWPSARPSLHPPRLTVYRLSHSQPGHPREEKTDERRSPQPQDPHLHGWPGAAH